MSMGCIIEKDFIEPREPCQTCNTNNFSPIDHIIYRINSIIKQSPSDMVTIAAGGAMPKIDVQEVMKQCIKLMKIKTKKYYAYHNEERSLQGKQLCEREVKWIQLTDEVATSIDKTYDPLTPCQFREVYQYIVIDPINRKIAMWSELGKIPKINFNSTQNNIIPYQLPQVEAIKATAKQYYLDGPLNPSDNDYGLNI